MKDFFNSIYGEGQENIKVDVVGQKLIIREKRLIRLALKRNTYMQKSFNYCYNSRDH